MPSITILDRVIAAPAVSIQAARSFAAEIIQVFGRDAAGVKLEREFASARLTLTSANEALAGYVVALLGEAEARKRLEAAGWKRHHYGKALPQGAPPSPSSARPAANASADRVAALTRAFDEFASNEPNNPRNLAEAKADIALAVKKFSDPGIRAAYPMTAAAVDFAQKNCGDFTTALRSVANISSTGARELAAKLKTSAESASPTYKGSKLIQSFIGKTDTKASPPAPRVSKDHALLLEWQSMPRGDARSEFGAKHFDAIRRALAAKK